MDPCFKKTQSLMPPLKIFKQLVWWIQASQPANAGDVGSVPGLGRSPGEGNGYSLQHSCLESSMDRRAWWATVHGVAKTERLTHEKP